MGLPVFAAGVDGVVVSVERWLRISATVSRGCWGIERPRLDVVDASRGILVAVVVFGLVFDVLQKVCFSVSNFIN